MSLNLLEMAVMGYFQQNPTSYFTPRQVAKALGYSEKNEINLVYHMIWRLKHDRRLGCEKINGRYHYKYRLVLKEW